MEELLNCSNVQFAAEDLRESMQLIEPYVLKCAAIEKCSKVIL